MGEKEKEHEDLVVMSALSSGGYHLLVVVTTPTGQQHPTKNWSYWSKATKTMGKSQKPFENHISSLN